MGLTASQRLRFDVQGYIVLEGLLDSGEVERLRAVLYRLRDDPHRADKGVYAITKGRSYYIRMGNLVEYDPEIVRFAAHPRIVPLAEDLVGGSVRLEENESIINRRNPAADVDALRLTRPNATRWHRALDPSWGCYIERGHQHYLFVKAIAYLTDIGPDDGGTCLIPGSHRMMWPRAEILAAAAEDPSLVHCVEARRGSVLLFAESLLHSTTEILSDRERVILSSGYVAPMLRMEQGNRVRPEFVETQPEEIRPLLSGSQRWNWRRHYD